MKARNSNLEMLRIICMLMIIAHHYSVHGFASFGLTYGVNRHLVDILSMGGKLGVNIFVLISGYFMVKSEVTLRKLFLIIGQTWFYSVGILVLFLMVLSPVTPIDNIAVKKSILPVTHGIYWFITCYIILMILSPYINILVNNMSKKMHSGLIAIFLIIWSIIPSIFRQNLWQFSELGWFVVLYLIAAYIRKYIETGNVKNTKNIITSIVLSVLLIGSVVTMDYLGYTFKIKELSVMRRWYSSLNSIIVVALSIALFLMFLRMKEYRNTIINTIASAMLGVYLIHDNFILRPYIWDVIFKNKEMYSSPYLIVHALCTVLIIFVVCVIVELLRKWISNLFRRTK